jgi:hypothetical protein
MDFHIINPLIKQLEDARDDKSEARNILLGQIDYCHRLSDDSDEVIDDSDDYTNAYLEQDLINSMVRLLIVVLGANGRTDQYVAEFDKVITGIQANKGCLMGD